MDKLKLLYAEDEIFLGKIVKESLESRGFNIHMVGDGREVIRAFHDFKPDVCVLDVMMPHRDGFELVKEIRRSNPAMPIIFLTAKTQTEDVLQGFMSGGNDYLKKPFSMEELIIRIQNLHKLFTGGQIKSDVFKESYDLGNYTFSTQLQELKYGDEIKKFSFRETELLKILSENVNQRVNRKDILMKVWGDDSYFNSRNLDVYITKLREYFRRDARIEIVTLKGVGNLFKVNDADKVSELTFSRK